MTNKELENEIKLFKEYLEGKKSDQPLTAWNGIQILTLLQKILREIKKDGDDLDFYVRANNLY